jgi:osmotically-inducible protein OsmY
LLASLVITLPAVLSGCALAAFGGAAATVAVANDPRTTGSMIEDQSIELKAQKAIADRKDIGSPSHLSVISYNQIALVTGEAPTEELRRQAIDLVRGIDKVRHVYDEVQIAAPRSMMSRSNDAVITGKVKTRLLATRKIDATRVKVITSGGIVYLMGMVTVAQSDAAATAASRVGGVQKVVKLFETVPAQDPS